MSAQPSHLSDLSGTTARATDSSRIEEVFTGIPLPVPRDDVEAGPSGRAPKRSLWTKLTGLLTRNNSAAESAKGSNDSLELEELSHNGAAIRPATQPAAEWPPGAGNLKVGFIVVGGWLKDFSPLLFGGCLLLFLLGVLITGLVMNANQKAEG